MLLSRTLIINYRGLFVVSRRSGNSNQNYEISMLGC